MAKLTLTFKGKPIRAYQFEAGDCVSIGRNDENDIRIDSLAVAPIHAEILFGDQGSIITQKENDFPLQVNNTQTARHELQHGDQISIGKHVLYFMDETTLLETPSARDSLETDLRLLDDELKQSSQTVDGQLQILNGRNIGRVLLLKRGLTRLGKPETGVAVIAKRKDGFYIAALDGGAQIKLNGKTVHDKSIKLNQGDRVEIDRTEMLFFVNQLSPQLEES
ncbi:MAG: FHA domain-containing protein [Methylococcaceae bacterium]|nr:FHA domain-containing protein [Methylococcaceae bacterium]